MDITIHLEASELAAAIRDLAVALNGTPEKISTDKTEKAKPKAAAAAAAPAPEPAAVAAEPAKAAAKPEALAPPSQPVISLEQVRVKLAALAQAGKQAAVKELLLKLGANKLTEVPAEKYEELMTAAEAI